MTAASSEAMDALFEAGFKPHYDSRSSKIVFSDDDFETAQAISDYAVEGAAEGTQDSERIAESIRFVANHGHGKNAIADAIARRFL